MKESPAQTAKTNGSDVPDVAECVEAVFGCKWSIRILTLICRGVCRPGEIERSLAGLTTKVQHHYFRRMVALGILRREVYAEVPPRVEYRLTPFGERFVPLLEQIARFQRELSGEIGGETAAGSSVTSLPGKSTPPNQALPQDTRNRNGHVDERRSNRP